MNLNESDFAKNGIYIKKMPSQLKMFNLLNKLRPVKTEFNLIRVGSENDGGYLLPDDLNSIKACFSPGVDTNASFEKDLLQNFQIESHLADLSVDAPPNELKPKSFIKKFLGGFNTEHHITLESWVNCMEPDLRENLESDLILQMDIEGAEYETLLTSPDTLLRRFRIIVLEIHYVESWGDPQFHKMVSLFFDKLLNSFNVVHVHPNNCCGLVHFGKLVAPRVFEITLLRKDRSPILGYADEFPHHLDRPNLEHNQDLPLPNQWWNEEIIQNLKVALQDSKEIQKNIDVKAPTETATQLYEEQIANIRMQYENSRSWKLTAPLRLLSNFFKKRG